ncbi:hypothetical protein K5V21_04385 [Clostridium sardiniense]|uniref:Uncharacterized protein n=1 Tax=Clostridium sardiniense TaxID=29369 RepID=A0ABS7KV58_CLOSR|nr:hypothetical protein [Clostridium sardiniense]MBY0754690.1 hypothetical protein [Clostridium sardiniense]MDQ0460590.1 hypothetical protein [Clostridium sardiniense]
MAKKTSKNNDLLYTARENTSPKVYDIILDLVNKDKENIAKDVMKVDYLLEYTSTCIKQKDFREARETIDRVSERIKILKENGANTEYLEYLRDGIKNKIK